MAQKFLKTKEKISKWLDQYEVKNYTIVEDPNYGYVVNVRLGVNLSSRRLSTIPVKFASVYGNFDCSYNKLTSLEFCPHTVRGFFSCEQNQIASLEFCPTHVGGDFDCGNNKLRTLEFCPQTLVGGLYCYDNLLQSLEYFPHSVAGEVICSGNKNLGDFQDIERFKTLHQEHLRIVSIKKEKELLGSLVKVETLATKNNSNPFKV